MKKVYKRLTPDQIKRDVVFSSCLSIQRVEAADNCIHEVFKDQSPDAREKKIGLLLDDKFFNDSPWNFNIIRGAS